MTYHCPKCGEDTDVLDEGYCPPCSAEGRNELMLHNARVDWWENLSDAERDAQIKRAVRY